MWSNVRGVPKYKNFKLSQTGFELAHLCESYYKTVYFLELITAEFITCGLVPLKIAFICF